MLAGAVIPLTNGSTQRSRLKRESRTPATTAMVMPVSTYNAAICQPTIPASMTTPIWLISGEVIRKVSVTPSGTPAATKPMNSGTEEQEQNGVIAPKTAASANPTATWRPTIRSRTFSGGTADRARLIAKISPTMSSMILAVS
jgi:hypothetical protein